MEELLKEQGFTDEQIATITGAMTTKKIYTTKVENADVRYQKATDDKKDLEKQLNTANTTITNLKQYETDNEKLKGDIATYEATNETYKKELEAKDFNYAIDKAFGDYKVSDSKAKLVKSLLENDKLKVVDGTVIGLKEQIEAIKKDHDYLFEKEIGGTGSFETGGAGGKESDQKESFATQLGKQKAEQIQAKGIADFIK
ncbi:MAG: phage scaffolding protein [Clostridium sp.]|uniref:phage scaffolding protein n=1 Tax=Clostridium sp. TaxID=1506 RepID=UPI002FCC09C7